MLHSLKFFFCKSILPTILPYINNLSLRCRRLFHRRSSHTTLVINQFIPTSIVGRNEIYDAVESYLSTRVVTTHRGRLNISKCPKENSVTIGFESDQQINDVFDNTPVSWRFVCTPEKRRFFELSFDTESNDKIINSYIPHVLKSFNNNKKTTLKLCTPGSANYWDMVKLEQHPSTLDTIAMDPDLKWDIMHDLDQFVKRKEYYKRVGRAWKRGYLLYGPSGTGKSSLVAAMANYLRFDIYDLQLENIINSNNNNINDFDYLRRLLVAIPNRSILVIEDIGSARLLHNGKYTKSSGLLNLIGLWSNCGDERITVFTTKHDKERLDETLVRPEIMDMHIHMDYLTFPGFQILVENYLQFKGQHDLFQKIEYLMKDVKVTPAEVAQELMKYDTVILALMRVIDLLRSKKKAMEGNRNDGSIDVDDGPIDDDDDDDGCIDEDEDGGGFITSIDDDDDDEDGGTSDDEF